MAQESSAEGTRLTSADVLRVLAATLGVAVLTAGALLLLLAVLLGQALGGVIVALMGRSAAVMSDGKALALVILIFAGQLGLSWLAASRLTPPTRRRPARQLAIGLSLFLCLLPVLGFGLMKRGMQTQRQDLLQKLEQRHEEERQHRRAENEARLAELQRNLELEKQRREERRKEEAAIEVHKQQVIDEAKRNIGAARARKNQ